MNQGNKKFDVAVIGGGIMGVAMAYMAALENNSVVVFEQDEVTKGSSLNNFGCIWPIGQHHSFYERAMRSRTIWMELAEKANIWMNRAGSLILAHHEDEYHVLEEFYATKKNNPYQIELITPLKAISLNPLINPISLEGALFSKTELNIDSRQAIPAIYKYLKEALGVQILNKTQITAVDYPHIHSHTGTWNAERVYICNGAHFGNGMLGYERKRGLKAYHLQMVRTKAILRNIRSFPSMASGMSMQHFPAFEHCDSLELLRRRILLDVHQGKNWTGGITVASTQWNELVIGDPYGYHQNENHEDTMSSKDLYRKIKKVIRLSDFEINSYLKESYLRMPSYNEYIEKVAENVLLINGLSGFGLSLSFGLAYELLNAKATI